MSCPSCGAHNSHWGESYYVPPEKEAPVTVSSHAEESLVSSEENEEQPTDNSSFLSVVPILSLVIGLAGGAFAYSQTNDFYYAGGGVIGGGLAAALALHIMYHAIMILIELVKIAAKIGAVLLAIVFAGNWFEFTWAREVVEYVQQIIS